MGWLTGLSIKTYIYAAVAIVIAGMALGLRIQTSRLATSKAETVAVQGRFDAFVATAKALGDAQNAKAKDQELADKQRKEKADATHKTTVLALLADIERMRSATPDPHSSKLPAAAPGSGRPDLLCLDRAEYQRTDGDALAKLFEGARSLADEGSKNTLKLSTAAEWAASLAK